MASAIGFFLPKKQESHLLIPLFSTKMFSTILAVHLNTCGNLQIHIAFPTKSQGLIMSFSDLSFRKKIFLLLALPMLGFLWLSISSIIDSVKTSDEMSTITRVTNKQVPG
jgi:hypothetical protein